MVGLMIIGVYSSFLFQEKKSHKLMSDGWRHGRLSRSEPHWGRKPCGETLEKSSQILKVEHIHTMAMKWSGDAYSSVLCRMKSVRMSNLYDELAKHEDMFPKECINQW
jgi:hypothetical protein